MIIFNLPSQVSVTWDQADKFWNNFTTFYKASFVETCTASQFTPLKHFLKLCLSSFKFWKESWLKNCVNQIFGLFIKTLGNQFFCEPYILHRVCWSMSLYSVTSKRRSQRIQTGNGILLSWATTRRNVTKRKYPVINIPAFESIPIEKIYFFSIYLYLFKKKQKSSYTTYTTYTVKHVFLSWFKEVVREHLFIPQPMIIKNVFFEIFV